MEINYIGHSTVELVEGDTRVLIDPFLKPNNPAAKVTADDVEPTHVFITHAHADHFADAVAVGKRTGASFVAITELANVLNEQGIEDASDANLGDTALFSDLKLIAERTPVDVAFIPIGGHYTMDRHDAVVAADFVGAETVIPIHFNTFPPIETDAEAFKKDVESKTSSKVVVLAPGESHSV